MKKNSRFGLLVDVVLTVVTGGFWLIVVAIRWMRANSK